MRKALPVWTELGCAKEVSMSCQAKNLGERDRLTRS
jgi:hypothetical protein